MVVDVSTDGVATTGTTARLANASYNVTVTAAAFNTAVGTDILTAGTYSGKIDISVALTV